MPSLCIVGRRTRHRRTSTRTPLLPLTLLPLVSRFPDLRRKYIGRLMPPRRLARLPHPLHQPPHLCRPPPSFLLLQERAMLQVLRPRALR